jgi:predicted transcriptional regulator
MHLISIKPKYNNLIFKKIKTIEYRKSLLGCEGDKIFIYETAPTSKVIGEAFIAKVYTGSILDIWDKTGHKSGIGLTEYLAYFCNKVNHKDKAFAFELINVVKYSTPKSLKDFNLKHAPMSFVKLKVE